ncbi:SDR family oxidoreductase [Prosthecomicrobium pneumaticum]|nr:SDR family oxidoreductase [Prosthecomicrobium pneumaticum]
MKVALVTGGARRIGRAIVEALAEAGWAVAIHCNSARDEAEALAEAIRGAGGRAAVVVADLADPQAVRALVPAAAAALGPVTLLVNNASLFLPDGIGTLDPSVWRRQMAVNLDAPVFLADALATALPAGETANVVNILDQRVLKTTPLFLSYQLSKSALFTATRVLAQALAPRVRVNGIGPGPTLASVRQAPEDFARQSAAVPLGRGPDLSEFGRTILYLVGTPSVTGQMIAIDGGQHLAWQTPDIVGIPE